MTNLTGRELEDFGQEIFTKMGLNCVHRLGQVRLLDVDPTAHFQTNEHFEFDYLIPFDNACLIGEITSRNNPNDVRNKYRRFGRHFDFLSRRNLSEHTWRLLGVTDEDLRSFREVTDLKCFFITTRLQRFDVRLDDVSHIARFYKSDWDLLEDYAQSIGSYAKPHFLHRFDVMPTSTRHALILSQDAHDLMRTSNKIVASDVDLANIYTFEISPYELLPMAQVYRKDELPNLSSNPGMDYQRLLLPSKLRTIRRDLLVTPDFMFPNSILVVLSNDCEYSDRGRSLTIPRKYGTISIIDGQHRLFSYANDEIQQELGKDCKIMVTAIQFLDADFETINRFSARTFVEINTNQTRVPPTHLDAIAYDILGETHARAIAAKIILEANERNRRSKIYGLFDTNRTGLGVIQVTSVLTALKAITNLRRIEALRQAQSGNPLQQKLGYENLFEVSIERLCQPEVLIEQGIICFEKYFNFVGRTFSHDWPKRRHENESSLRFAKMISGFVKLLWKDFISGGYDWDDVREELESIKANIMQLRNMQDCDDILFDPNDPHIPDSDPRDNDNYRFLSQNRHQPVSIQTILGQ